MQITGFMFFLHGSQPPNSKCLANLSPKARLISSKFKASIAQWAVPQYRPCFYRGFWKKKVRTKGKAIAEHCGQESGTVIGPPKPTPPADQESVTKSAGLKCRKAFLPQPETTTTEEKATPSVYITGLGVPGSEHVGLECSIHITHTNWILNLSRKVSAPFWC